MRSAAYGSWLGVALVDSDIVGALRHRKPGVWRAAFPPEVRGLGGQLRDAREQYLLREGLSHDWDFSLASEA